MSVAELALPEVTRPGVGLVVVEEWSTAALGQQQPAVDAAISAWEHVPWTQGLIAYHGLIGADGVNVLHYFQWFDAEAASVFHNADRTAWERQVDAAVPGIERADATGYHVYRSTGRASSQPPGCIVAVSHAFDTPGLDQARGFIDGMFTSLDDDPMPGFIAAHFHISPDGARMLNLAEWETVPAYAAWAYGEAQPPAPEPVQGEDASSQPQTRIRQYRPYRGLVSD